MRTDQALLAGHPEFGMSGRAVSGMSGHFYDRSTLMLALTR
jgi:hypothetical protein